MVAIIAVTGVIAATLLTTTMYAVGYASSSRASVQAQAAADGGIDYALLNLTACSNGVITSPASTTPVFRVVVDHRVTNGAWVNGSCPAASAAQVRLTSTGDAAARAWTARCAATPARSRPSPSPCRL